eukprot:m.85576 g.85576  ORF g.85576 m.85576 type:complete len:183 (-) comp15059_c0_seq1:128-676(-)
MSRRAGAGAAAGGDVPTPVSDNGSFGVVRADADMEAERVVLDHLMRQSAVQVVLIEDDRLGEAAARSIQIGNFFHKTAVLTGLTGVIAGLASPLRKALVPAGAASVLCAITYNLAWKSDPMSKFQIDRTGEGVQNVPVDRLDTRDHYIVLVRRDDGVRVKLHNTLALLVCLAGAYHYRHLYL